MLPIMVKSLACHLRGAKKSTLISLGEEANDFGGYFVAGGLEKCLRILISNVSEHAYLNSIDDVQEHSLYNNVIITM